MAHFAEIINDEVVRVLVMSNDLSFRESLRWLRRNVSKNRWVQTSYNNNFRGNFAGKGYKYDRSLDAFIPPKPYKSFILNKETFRYEAPVPFPDTDKPYEWSEEKLDWEIIDE